MLMHPRSTALVATDDRSMSHRLIGRACLGAMAVALVALMTLLPVPLAAQEGALAPTKVTVAGEGTTVTVTWTPVRAEGVTYRVLRALNGKEPGADITKEPVDAASVVDPEVVPGTTYFYQVIAMYRDETSAAAAPVEFTVPKAELVAPIAAPIITSQPIITSEPISLAGTPKTLLPTAVTGITVNGTTASAVVSWQPVAGAVSYTIKRSKPDNVLCCKGSPPMRYPDEASTATVPGLTTTTWTDLGMQGVGFPMAGVYLYEVTAVLGGGTSVSGQANWTRPDPTCAAPLPNQPMLAALNPVWGPLEFVKYGPYPSGAMFSWDAVKDKFMAYRMERSVQGTDAWTLAATSCVGASLTVGMGKNLQWYGRFDDGLAGIVPNTTYLYRMTAFVGNGEAGVGTVSWTAPSQVVLRWFPATISGNTITLKVRYEPPVTNAPGSPSSFRVTSHSGLNPGSPSGSCDGVAGCSYVVNAVPSGTHRFTFTAEWKKNGLGPVIATTSSDTTVIVP